MFYVAINANANPIARGKILADAGKNSVLFAEATSCQLEFKYLAKITGKKEYYQRVRQFTVRLE